MTIQQIKERFWIPSDCYYLKAKGTKKVDENLIRIGLNEHLEIDSYVPNQVYYILNSKSKLILEFNEDVYEEIISLIKK